MKHKQLLQRICLLLLAMICHSVQMHAYAPEHYYVGTRIIDNYPTGKGSAYINEYEARTLEHDGITYFSRYTSDAGGYVSYNISTSDVVKGWAVSRFSEGNYSNNTLYVQASTDHLETKFYSVTAIWKAQLYDDPDNENYVALTDLSAGFLDQTCDAEVFRTLSPNYLNPICLPFDYEPDGWEVYMYNGDYLDGETLTLKFSSYNGPLKAGVPYLVKPKQEVTSMYALDCDLIQEGGVVMGNYYDFIGNITPTRVQEGDIYVSTSNTLKRCTKEGGFALKCYRAYFQKKSNAADVKSLSIQVDGQTTPIEDILMDEGNGTDAIYDLSGRRLREKPRQGAYIQNGRKRLVK